MKPGTLVKAMVKNFKNILDLSITSIGIEIRWCNVSALMMRLTGTYSSSKKKIDFKAKSFFH